MRTIHVESIALARARLEILYADTGQSSHRLTNREEREAIRAILDELHRLHLAVSEQRKRLQSIANRKNKTYRKPAAARSQRPTAHRTRQNKERRRP